MWYIRVSPSVVGRCGEGSPRSHRDTHLQTPFNFTLCGSADSPVRPAAEAVTGYERHLFSKPQKSSFHRSHHRSMESRMSVCR